MCRIYRVNGDSLYPEYRNGDYVITAWSPFPFKRLRLGEIVAFKHPKYGLLIKQVTHIDQEMGLLEVQGTILESIDSRNFGPIPMHSVLGKMIWHIKAPRKNDP